MASEPWKPWWERKSRDQIVQEAIDRLQEELRQIFEPRNEAEERDQEDRSHE